MRRLRTIRVAVIALGVACGGLAGAALPALAAIDCTTGDAYERTQTDHHFVAVDSVKAVNNSSSSASITVQVGVQHTSSRSFTGTISAGAAAGFWIFAKAKAEASGSVTILTSTTMFATYSVTATVPAKSSRLVTFGFDKYDQYVRRYHLVNASPTTCKRIYDQEGWVRAPVTKTFRITNA